jgi:hypothetical protein
MKVRKFKYHYRIEVSGLYTDWILKKSLIIEFKKWCKKHVKEYDARTAWGNKENLPWYIPFGRQRVYVYLKEETDVSLFLLTFSGKELNEISVDK